MAVSTIEKPWTVSITDTNHARLLAIKKDGERMNDAVSRILDVYEQFLEQKPASSDLAECKAGYPQEDKQCQTLKLK